MASALWGKICGMLQTQNQQPFREKQMQKCLAGMVLLIGSRNSKGVCKLFFSARIGAFALAVVLLRIFLCTNAYSQTVTVEQYRHPQNEKDLSINKAYLYGIKDGLVAYNMRAEEKLFCSPEASTLTFERASELLIQWARKRGSTAAILPLSISVLQSLEEAFPCSNKH
jgi:hypothetical protein